ncbi:cyclophilin-like fold protein [Acinetobacter sp. 'aerobic (ED)']|uniref:cyclophilin-like fold protein n=1 Tax=Acinetobacter sp. 'aerobic (ED)' TaxID=174230 RepID=UPI00192BB956|nr:cyclophilin-like fold protein [Acinetobacter sp. 'aerobic (ED)']
MNWSNQIRAMVVLTAMFGLSACGGDQNSSSNAPIVTESLNNASGTENPNNPEQPNTEGEQMNMWMTVNGHRFGITFKDNATARAFAAQLPLSLNMEELNGNEKHTQLPSTLPTDASRPGIINNGDLMLYGSSTLVMFYKTFPSAYSYTRIGKVNQPDKLADLLGRGNVRIEFSRD